MKVTERYIKRFSKNFNQKKEEFNEGFETKKFLNLAVAGLWLF